MLKLTLTPSKTKSNTKALTLAPKDSNEVPTKQASPEPTPEIQVTKASISTAKPIKLTLSASSTTGCMPDPVSTPTKPSVPVPSLALKLNLSNSSSSSERVCTDLNPSQPVRTQEVPEDGKLPVRESTPQPETSGAIREKSKVASIKLNLPTKRTDSTRPTGKPAPVTKKVVLKLGAKPLVAAKAKPAHLKASSSDPSVKVYDTSKMTAKPKGMKLNTVAVKAMGMRLGKTNPTGKTPTSEPLKETLTRVSTTLPVLPKLPSLVAEVTEDETPINPDLVGISNTAGVYYEQLNSEQRKAVNLTVEGYSFCLTGAAGSGKTTTQSIAIEALLRSTSVRRIPSMAIPHKYVHEGAPSVVIVSFTNKAVENIRKLVPQEMKNNCMTIHKLLEYAPIKEDDVALIDGEEVDIEKEIWRPRRHEDNPLEGITHIFMEEGSNVGMELTRELKKAIPYEITMVFMGDLNQLQPVGDVATLGYAIACLPEVNLQKVYRQGAESPILTFAHKILEGAPISDEYMRSIAKPNELVVTPVAKYFHPAVEMKHIGSMFKGKAKRGDWDSANTVALLPFHKGGDCNVLEFNRYVAQGFTEKDNLDVFEVINGYLRSYYCVGDVVFQNKQLWTITNITPNPKYVGVCPKTPSPYLTRWGDYVIPKDALNVASDMASIEDNIMDVDEMLASVNTSALVQEESTRQSSHTINLAPLAKHNAGTEDAIVSSAAECNDMQLGYALSYHKSQGSEWDTVHVIAVREHQKMIMREHIYTACTRAKQCLHILYATQAEKGGSNAKASMLATGIIRQEVEGDTPIQKKQHFVRKLEMETKRKVLAAKVTAKKARWPDSKLAKRIQQINDTDSIRAEFQTHLRTKVI
mgnify:CR=1 FL=1